MVEPNRTFLQWCILWIPNIEKEIWLSPAFLLPQWHEILTVSFSFPCVIALLHLCLQHALTGKMILEPTPSKLWMTQGHWTRSSTSNLPTAHSHLMSLFPYGRVRLAKPLKRFMFQRSKFWRTFKVSMKTFGKFCILV